MAVLHTRASAPESSKPDATQKNEAQYFTALR